MAFERIADLKTVHAAAADLSLTQAALTKRLRLLEQELGVTLFLRSRRGMSLTEEGKALLQFCKTSNEAEGQLVSKLKGVGKMEISLTITGPTSALSSRINKDCLPLYTKYPHLKLHFKAEDHANLIEMVRQGKADLAVVPPNLVPNEMDSKVLKADRYLLVASAKWQRRSLAEILEQERIIDFYESDMTTFNYLKKFGLEKSKRPDRLYVNNNSALIRMFKAGVGYGTLTEDIAKPFLESGELIKLNRGQVFEDPLALTWYPRHEKADYFHDLIRSIK
ncbi:LysR family transcriptional regulator [Bdellovibrio sp. HCB337]|uniref:LysR family transcriptional regulator n=1 Tax=Bdellovibrio sp. HCB337 TaxID=3394358 RepID=UPI0039A58B95